MSRIAPLSLVVALLLVGGLAEARRTPAPGGNLSIALPADMVPAFVEAHTTIPVVERVSARDPRGRIFEQPLIGAPQWRSALLTRVTSSARATRYALEGDLPPGLVVQVLTSCFDASAPGASWPADVLRAAGISPTIEVDRTRVVVTFPSTFGPFVELLAGCLVRGPNLAPYARVEPSTLAAQRAALEGLPVIVRIELRPDGESGDVVVGGAPSGGAATLIAPYPDVLLLVQGKEAIAKDPFGLSPPDGSLRAFHDELIPDLLAVTYWSGRGGRWPYILPQGLAPARPLPEPTTTSTRPLALTLGPLDERAERIVVRRAENDPLVGGVVDRLAVLLRTRGYGLTPMAPLSSESGVAVVRWRPTSDDPALALLALAGQHAALHDDDTRAWLADPRLLSTDFDERVAGAIALERTWVESRRVVPLLFAELQYAVDPAMRGVRVRPDGVPVVDDAAWSVVR